MTDRRGELAGGEPDDRIAGCKHMYMFSFVLFPFILGNECIFILGTIR